MFRISPQIMSGYRPEGSQLSAIGSIASGPVHNKCSEKSRHFWDRQHFPWSSAPVEKPTSSKFLGLP